MKSKSISYVSGLLLSVSYHLQDAHAWTSSITHHRNSPLKSSLAAQVSKVGIDEHEYVHEEDGANQSLSSSSSCRRGFLTKSIAATCSSVIGVTYANPLPASAASGKPSAQELTDKGNVVKGYKRLDYLLANWDKETTICGRTDNPYIGCERTPEKVMSYLGFKSMNDPLFRIDKTLFRLQNLVSGSDDEIDYMEAMEVINQAVEDGNSIAFVSSWGEANPGGGQDRIELFIERSKQYVIATRDGLGTIIKILDLKMD